MYCLSIRKVTTSLGIVLAAITLHSSVTHAMPLLGKPGALVRRQTSALKRCLIHRVLKKELQPGQPLSIEGATYEVVKVTERGAGAMAAYMTVALKKAVGPPQTAVINVQLKDAKLTNWRLWRGRPGSLRETQDLISVWGKKKLSPDDTKWPVIVLPQDKLGSFLDPGPMRANVGPIREFSNDGNSDIAGMFMAAMSELAGGRKNPPGIRSLLSEQQGGPESFLGLTDGQGKPLSYPAQTASSSASRDEDLLKGGL